MKTPHIEKAMKIIRSLPSSQEARYLAFQAFMKFMEMDGLKRGSMAIRVFEDGTCDISCEYSKAPQRKRTKTLTLKPGAELTHIKPKTSRRGHGRK